MTLDTLIVPSSALLEHDGTARRDIELQPAFAILGIERVIVRRMHDAVIGEAVAAEGFGVAVELDLVFALRHEETVIGERAGRRKVEDEDQRPARVGQHLIPIIVPDFLHGDGFDGRHAREHAQHGLIEIAEPMIAERLVVDEMPLAARVFITPAVALAREINPLGVAEFVAHEIQIAAIHRRGRGETDHLVQGDAARDRTTLVPLAEMPVHIGIDEAEDDRLVAHERLVVALAIGNGALPLPTVRELPINARGMPILVFFLLDELDPVVGDVHGEAVIKTIAARRKGRREAGHAADILGDGDGVGIHLVDELVRERQIADGVIVLMPVEISR